MRKEKRGNFGETQHVVVRHLFLDIIQGEKVLNASSTPPDKQATLLTHGRFIRMKEAFRGVKPRLALLIAAATMMCCAPGSHINITYRLPTPSHALNAREIYLEFKDLRPYESVLGIRARSEFDQDSGLFLLSVEPESQEGYLAGAFDLASLFKEAFRQRLGNLGFSVSPLPKENAPEIEIALKEFFLELFDRKWIATINYETALIAGGQVRARQTVSGDAVRAKLISHRDAETVLSEIFTDTINRLDIYRLLREARLN